MKLDMIEFVDLIFADDSVPAIFAITIDSITFAILFIGIMYSLWETKRSE